MGLGRRDVSCPLCPWVCKASAGDRPSAYSVGRGAGAGEGAGALLSFTLGEGTCA